MKHLPGPEHRGRECTEHRRESPRPAMRRRQMTQISERHAEDDRKHQRRAAEEQRRRQVIEQHAQTGRWNMNE